MTHAAKSAAPRLARRSALLIAAGLFALSSAACETGSVLSTGTPAASTVNTAQHMVTRKKVAIAPVIGAPSNVSKQLETMMASAVQKQSVPVTKAGEQADYMVRGYVVAAPAAKGTKLTYIWDVTDKTGKRAHRISGEELVTGKASKDPWANVNAGVIDRIAQKSATQLVSWIPKNAPVKVAPAVPAKPVKPHTPSSTTTPIAKAKPIVQNAALQKTAVYSAVVPAVSGAPGDGNKSLAKALQKQLSTKGVRLGTNAGPTAYAVRGRVTMGQPAAGKQNIKIEWQVIDPAGKRVGVVSQKNSVAQGSLDGNWGRIADAAATAAAQGIVKLLPDKAKTRIN